ncbi:MAG: response regulator transcription factor [Flammeovirgaceae bacterium]|nr:MAG: response regulator transcription factor [Flammeovirgaceae bacterium]
MEKGTLYLVDDHQLVIDGIIALVEGSGEWKVIGYANSGEEALRKIPILKPDIILMDLEMPRMNGLQCTEKLLAHNPQAKVVILTFHQEKALVQKMVKMGVSGYIMKNAPRQEFLTGLQLVRQGGKFYSSQLTESMLEVNPLAVRKESNIKLLALLSQREREVLKLIAEGISSKSIAEKLNLSPATVETHRKNLLKKLNARNSAALIRMALTEGLLD